MERPEDYMDTILGMTVYVSICILKSPVCPF